MSEGRQRHTSPSRPIKVLFEDEHYVVFDKPAGLLVIPSPKEDNTLVHIVNSRYISPEDSFRLHPCHRLDRDTSGAIIFAKGKKKQQLMMQLFRQRAIRKKYIAFVHGKLKPQQGEMRSMIKDFHQKKFDRHSRARLAITRYRVIETRKYFSIVEASPLTGRTNQIRIQFSEAGFPLVGERKYAFARDFALRFRRVALHASTLEWLHPVMHKPIKVVSPLPEDMVEFIARNENKTRSQ